MFRSTLPRIAVTVLLALGTTARAAPAQSYDTVQVRTIRVTEGVYVLMARGGNIGVSVGPDGVFLVDDQYAPLTSKIHAAVTAITDRPIRFVLNTHWHFDHTGGNENFGRAGALIVAHGNVRRRMSGRQFIEVMMWEQPASPPGALPVVTFSDTVTFHLNGDEVVAVHVPHAHTDGHAVVHFRKANVIHMGDVFVNGYRFIDVPGGGSIDGIIGAVERVLVATDEHTRVIPGHGDIQTRAALQTYRDMLVAIRDRVQRQIIAGADLPAVIASRPTAEFDGVWGKGMVQSDQFVRWVYTNLSRR